MNKKNQARIYIDSCIAIEMAKHVLKVHQRDRENDLWFMRQMLKASSNQELDLLTSSLTVAEALHLGKDDQGNRIECPPDVQEFLINLLTSGSLIKLVQPSLFVAERARDLRWEHGLDLKPFDSIHVASAIDADCSEMLTWDREMNDKRAKEIQVISNLGLRVIPPHKSLLLPDEYRQQTLELSSPVARKLLPPPAPIQ